MSISMGRSEGLMGPIGRGRTYFVPWDQHPWMPGKLGVHFDVVSLQGLPLRMVVDGDRDGQPRRTWRDSGRQPIV